MTVKDCYRQALAVRTDAERLAFWAKVLRTIGSGIAEDPIALAQAALAAAAPADESAGAAAAED